MLRTGLELSEGRPRLLEVFSSRFGKTRTAILRKSGLRASRTMGPPCAFLGYLWLISNRLVI